MVETEKIYRVAAFFSIFYTMKNAPHEARPGSQNIKLI